MFVQLLSGHAGLDGDIQIFNVYAEHRLHLTEVDTHAAPQGCDMAFQRSADTKGNDWRAMLTADIHYLDYLVGRLWKHDRVRRLGRMVGFVSTMSIADRLVGRQAVAKILTQNMDRRLIFARGTIQIRA